MTTNSVFSDRLTKVREERGIKRQQAANDIGITRASLEYYEKGQRKPDTEILMKLCEYYKVSADYLLGISDAQITATEDETIKTVCDYFQIDEIALKILQRNIQQGGIHVLLRNRVLSVLPTLYTEYHNKLLEAIDELQKADIAAKNNEAEKAQGYVNNYLILSELMQSIVLTIKSSTDPTCLHDNILLWDKLYKLRDNSTIKTIIQSTSINDIFENMKYKGD